MIKQHIITPMLLSLFVIPYLNGMAPNTITSIVDDPGMYLAGYELGGIALNPTHNTAYVSVTSASRVAIIDTTTNTTVGYMENPYNYHLDSPTAIVSNDTKAYVICGNLDEIAVIDVASNAIIYEVANPGFRLLADLAISADGLSVYVTDVDTETPWIITIADDSVIASPTPHMDLGSFKIAVAPNTGQPYVTNPYNNLVYQAFTATPTSETNPGAIAISLDGTKAYVNTATDVAIIDLPSTPAGSISGSSNGASAITFTPDGTIAYLVNTPTLMVDVSTDSVTQTVADPHGYLTDPTQLVFTADGATGYIPNFHDTVAIMTYVTPSATILPPSSVSGCKTQNVFLLQTDFINNITWTAPTTGEAPAQYRIYRDPALTDLVATVSAAGTLQYYDHDRQPNVVYSYYIVSVAADGTPSTTANSVTVTQLCS